MTGDGALCERDALGNWLTVKTTLMPLCHLTTSAANTTTTVCHCVVCTPVPSYHSKPTVYTCVTTVETTNDDEALYHASLLRLETINQGGNCCTFGSFVKCLLFILHLSKSQALSFEGYNYLVIHNGLELCQKDMCFWASFFGLRNQKAERVFFAPSCVENVSVSLFFHDTFLHFAISLPPLYV